MPFVNTKSTTIFNVRRISLKTLAIESRVLAMTAALNASPRNTYSQVTITDSIILIHDVSYVNWSPFLTEMFTNEQNGLATTPISGPVIQVDEYVLKSNRK